MKSCFAIVATIACLTLAIGASASELAKGFTTGSPPVRAMSSLEFGPEGLLFIGDSKSGAVYVIDTGDRDSNEVPERFSVADIEGKIAAMMGTTGDNVMIHDMAVNPLSSTAYVSVSRDRGKWQSKWTLPNDLGDATTLFRIRPDQTIEEFELKNIRYTKAELPNPVDLNKAHRWKEGVTLRTDAITELVYHDGHVYVAGLSNEEFASTLWQMQFPFEGDAAWTTLEIFHGAHGEYETHAPIRTFLPYQIGGQAHILASYLCTPLVTFPLGELDNGKHIKGKTIAELGSGNYPLDMVVANHDGKEFIVMANSQLPLMTIDTSEIEKFNSAPGITRESPSYKEGVDYVARAGSGVLHLDSFTDSSLLALQRVPNGKLDLVSLSIQRLAF